MARSCSSPPTASPLAAESQRHGSVTFVRHDERIMSKSHPPDPSAERYEHRVKQQYHQYHHEGRRHGRIPPSTHWQYSEHSSYMQRPPKHEPSMVKPRQPQRPLDGSGKESSPQHRHSSRTNRTNLRPKISRNLSRTSSSESQVDAPSVVYVNGEDEMSMSTITTNNEAAEVRKLYTMLDQALDAQQNNYNNNNNNYNSYHSHNHPKYGQHHQRQRIDVAPSRPMRPDIAPSKPMRPSDSSISGSGSAPPPQQQRRPASPPSSHEMPAALRTTTPSSSSASDTAEIQVAPGHYEPLRRAQETMHALHNNQAEVVTCVCCEKALAVVSNCRFVICQDCRTISPMPADAHVGSATATTGTSTPSITGQPTSSAYGVGLGLRL